MIKPICLSIAGSDSSGGAGIQADLKTFEALDVFGTTVLTCVTAQNLNGVFGIQIIDKSLIEKQIRAVFEQFPISSLKTGMLFNAEIINLVSDVLKDLKAKNVVVDPVMVAASGAKLLEDEALNIYKKKLFPMVSIITPNLREFNLIIGRKIDEVLGFAEIKNEMKNVWEEFGCAIVVKGFKEKNEIKDIFFEGEEFAIFSHEEIKNVNTHGTGCSYSASLCAFLAKGESLKEACGKAKEFISNSLKNAVDLGGVRVLERHQRSGINDQEF
ncbi:bifunctional hydroxymethylpyrimidine kinase/phosphomethylpyrimidine kinase [Candidatus Peregrinibacteria bacterium RIFOXYC2_FULL_33_13]|nr:MAG: Hydroxymethylpyrimidine/phosphomethylpyrimidine kinase [Candidatus Peregrinibacteria bacterium GW2011_GWA2_33_10]KKP40912.1 MAG: phosphomethylpyrimidine kinase [Candidatus Peregrinibacteria bacterium GW2011_GWC2_33_13]OGJ50161.1 MAG: bifunctional hydroxymethylpyrimidine kinase/phosphomethylpyrimidine kinase [Candidatus Peregrinibacteria bacterium RIFOXYA2_FULL_33_7]OGJ54510.1 MAG: bifunctional hydroxymethylpyrimidine kinase/phosphomethylpyrimidine kinase [Candidatus Peregrinibacteria bac